MEADPSHLIYHCLLQISFADWTIWLYVVAVLCMVGLLALSAMIAGSETALFSVSKEEFAEWKESPNTTKKLAIRLLENPKRLLGTLLIFNNLVNISLITLFSYLFRRLIQANHLEGIFILVAIFLMTVFLLFFGEILPKMFANQKGYFFIERTIYWIKWAYYLFKPVANLLESISQFAEKRIRKKGYKIHLEELPEVLDEIQLDESATAEDKALIKGIVNFGTISVHDVMTSRVKITAFDIETPFAELLSKVQENGYSRVPIYHESIDRIEGILYAKDLLPHLHKEDFEWQSLLRERYYVPENKKIDKLLKEFQEKHVHMAIVVDEYGGTAGLVTLEDVMEEIVGEIQDESDEAEDKLFTKLDENTYLFEGKIAINDFCKALELDSEFFEDVRGDSLSLSGLLLEILARFPKLNEQITYDKFQFTVLSKTVKQIKVIKVTILEQEEEPIEKEIKNG